MYYYRLVYITFFSLFLSCCVYAKTYTEADLKSQVYITWHLGEDCKVNAPRTLSFGVNKESILCLRSGAPYQPLYFKLQPEKQKSSLSCAYGAGTYGDCSDDQLADHCTFKTANDQCIVKIKGVKTVDVAAADFLLKHSVSNSAVFDQYAPLYIVEQPKYGSINLSNIHAMAVASDGKEDIVEETATLTGAISATPVTVNFLIDGQSKNTDQLVVLRFVDKTACTITPTKQPDGSYGGSCSISLMPNRFGAATISGTANNYDKIEPASARVGAFFTISQSSYSISDGKCYLNAKNIAVTSANLKPARAHDIEIHDTYCENRAEGLNIPYPIADEYYGSLLFTFGSSKNAASQGYRPRLLRIKLNPNATNEQSVMSDIKEIYTWPNSDSAVDGDYLHIGSDTVYQTNFITLVSSTNINDPNRYKAKPYEFKSVYQSTTLPAPTEMSGFTPGFLLGGDLKDGTKSRYSNLIAVLGCDKISDGKCADDAQYTIQALNRVNMSWQPFSTSGLTLDKNSFAFLTDRLESPLFSYYNELYLMVLDANLKIFRYDFTTNVWSLAINTPVDKQELIDIGSPNSVPLNRDFRVNLDFDYHIYFPAGSKDDQRIWQCHLKTAKCNVILLENYWDPIPPADRNKTLSAAIPDMHDRLWINVTKPDEGQPLLERRYYDSFVIKIDKSTLSPQRPNPITVPEIHATKGDATQVATSGVVSTAVYNNIVPPNEDAKKS